MEYSLIPSDLAMKRAKTDGILSLNKTRKIRNWYLVIKEDLSKFRTIGIKFYEANIIKIDIFNSS